MSIILRKLIKINILNNVKQNNRCCHLLTKPFLYQSWNKTNTNLKIVPNLVKYSSGSYEGDGKTTVSILNRELDLGLMINSYSQYGFRLNNEMVIIGPMALFPRSVLSWNISNFEEINENSLSLFYLLEPKVDVLVLGIGDQIVTPSFSKRILHFMRKYSINVEILKTEQACATFNFLNAEGRMVAAALIPPQHISVNENDLMRRQARHSNLYSIEN